MKALSYSFLALLVLFFSLGMLFSQDFSGISSPQNPGGLQFEKIIIALGLFAVISLAFLNWENHAKKKKDKSEKS
jgi:hypothetical protein